MAYGKKHGGSKVEDQVEATIDNLLVQFGSEILKIVPGKVSTEVDAAYSFDKDESIKKALHIIDVSIVMTKVGGPRTNIYPALQGEGYRKGARPDQACLDMGGNPSRPRAPKQARHQLQFDPHVLPRTSHRCRRSWRLPHLTLRRSHPGLVQGLSLIHI